MQLAILRRHRLRNAVHSLLLPLALAMAALCGFVPCSIGAAPGRRRPLPRTCWPPSRCGRAGTGRACGIDGGPARAVPFFGEARYKKAIPRSPYPCPLTVSTP
jgi:hypothetical protein